MNPLHELLRIGKSTDGDEAGFQGLGRGVRGACLVDCLFFLG